MAAASTVVVVVLLLHGVILHFRVHRSPSFKLFLTADILVFLHLFQVADAH
jgi:hypothetical protein